MGTRYIIDEKGEVVLALVTDIVSDTAYAAGWDTVTDQAPSKNSIYSKIEALTSEMFTLAAIMGTL